jgi:two-component system, chemotaxis family, chemotaxis protein CheY
MNETQNASVVIVDDDRLMRALLGTILKQEGYQFLGEATDGHEALTMCEHTRPALVCLDINMPGPSGIEVLKILRERLPETRVVVISGDASMATVREAVSYGAAGYIIKPFTPARVGAALRAALRGSGEHPFG